MYKCAICRGVRVPDHAFRVFISYSGHAHFDICGKKRQSKFRRTVQIRICVKCLRRGGKNHEIALDKI